ncbi:MAG: rod shape-determining protein RodA [Chloroflexi bacterium]|nr:rod shape-determining protein RodA [Chloroflexota bacterium]
MEARWWRHFDYLLLVACLLLVGFGLAMIYSASMATLSSEAKIWDTPVARQAIYALVGLMGMFFMVLVDYRVLASLAPALYVIMVGLLSVILVLGQTTYGARRWLEISVLPLQPSEAAKLVLILVLAKFLAGNYTQGKSLSGLAFSGLMALVPAALIYFQPHLSAVLVILSLWLGMVLVAGVRWRYLGVGAAIALVVGPFAYFQLLHEYMKERIGAFLNPVADPMGVGYNMLQAQISVGSGGLLGKGYLQGTQSQLYFLRVQTTDFVFSVLGEELGFVGVVVLFALFALLLFRSLRVAALAADPLGRLVAVGVVVTVAVQIFIHVGSNVGLIPVAGVPLPFISYGGSSLISLLTGMGILQSIVLHHRKIEFA